MMGETYENMVDIVPAGESLCIRLSDPLEGKMKKKIFVFFTVVLMLAVSVVPASAEAEHIPVTGTCTIVAFNPNGGDPDFWYKYNPAETMLHFRYSTILFSCDYSDDRMDGYIVATDNWNWNDYDFNSPSPFTVREFGKITSSDENGVPTDLWEGSYVAYYDDYMNQTISTTLIGRGANKGLIAKTTGVNSVIEGTLLDTGH